ncbi:MAG: C25 family cysteine peptidase, partial [Vicinamibacteria bacterium]
LVNGVTYYYKLEDIETTGRTKLHGPVSATPAAGASRSEESSSPAAMIFGEPSTSSLRVLAQSPREIVLELATGGFRAEPQANGSVRLSIPGFSEDSQPGSPLLPVKRSWIPIEGARSVAVVSVHAEDVELFSSLRPMAADSPEIVASPRGTVRAGRRSRREGGAFRGEGLYPQDAARILEVGFQGDERKARVELSPLRWNRSTGELALARRLVVRLALSGRERSEHRETRGHRRREVTHRLVAREAGLYGTSYEELFGSGRRRASAASSVRLSRLGDAVPFHLEPDGERFGPGSMLYFVSEGASMSPYGNEAVYELESGAGGVRMPVVSASPQGSAVAFYWQEVSREENRYYQAGLLDADDLWLWDVLLAPVSPVRKSFPFEVSALAATGEPSRLSVRLQGTSDLPVSPDHHLRIEVNGTPVFETTFEGKSALRFTAEIPSGVLREGANELSLENVGDTGAAYSMVMLDRFAVSYPRRLVAEAGFLEGRFSESGVAEVDGLEGGAFVLEAGAEGTRWLGTSSRFRVESGRRYRVVSSRAVLRPELETVARSGLKSHRNGADYLIVGPRALLSAARPLLELRRTQGLRSRGVAIEEIYSEFGFGEPRPEALREFLSYAYHNWREPALRY